MWVGIEGGRDRDRDRDQDREGRMAEWEDSHGCNISRPSESDRKQREGAREPLAGRTADGAGSAGRDRCGGSGSSRD